MTFRKITFIFIALLLSSLFLLQYWLIQNFTKDVSSKIGQAAFEVSRATTETLIFRQHDTQPKNFAMSSRISVNEHLEILNSLSTIPHNVNISLQDGQKDKHLTINASGTSYEIAIPRTGIEKSLDSMSNKVLMSALVFIIIGLAAASHFARRLSQPLKNLQIASERVGRGDFGFQVKNQTKYQSLELKDTVDAFNEMSNKIEILQKENEKLQQQAQLSELTEITRGLAHTIRNPLNTLNLAIDQWSSCKETSDKEELAKISKHQIQRIDKWIRTFMDIMSNDTNLIENTDVKKLLLHCVDDLTLNNRFNVDIKLKVVQNEKNNHDNYILTAVKPELKGLLQSLISNAIEATEAALSKSSSEKNMPVLINLSQEKGTIKITILDQGVGFTEEIKSKLFSPHNTNKTYGAGMGIYLAHRIITLKYNGNLVISDNSNHKTNTSKNSENIQNSGAIITITLNNRV